MYSIPSSVYIHVPFCRHRCGYCNFTLVAGRDDLVDSFLDAIELEMQTQLATKQVARTIFLGGGTPTHLSLPKLERLLSIIAKWFNRSDDCEFTCEANPLDCTPEKLDVLRSAGVNRLSLGGQSFSDRKLSALERDHNSRQLSETLALCRNYFSNTSLDLIFAAPQETIEEWHQDIEQALRSPIEHLSTYGLTIERGSAFYGRVLRSDVAELDAELQLAMYEHAIDTMTEHGWDHYEVSSFAKPGYACRHNQVYWRGDAWWAFGPGAASFLPASCTTTESASGSSAMIRAVNHPSTTNYIRKVLAGQSAIHESDSLSSEERVRERLVFGLRQLAGIDIRQLDELLGCPARQLFEPHLSTFIDAGWIEQTGQQMKLTRRGLVISDGLWPKLLQGAR
jgi:oxygen-independent coproporphyrinogen-3 oxidase